MGTNVYFTSDLHLGHRNILGFGQREHSDIEEMHVAIVEKWNSKVRKQSDIVWVLGDVAFTIESLEWLNHMNGSKRLVLGNHDKFQYPVYKKYFNELYHFNKRYKGLVMTHIPIHPNELGRYGWNRNVHGHIHDPSKNNLGEFYFNVNMDIVGYAPVHLDEVREGMTNG